MVSTEPHIPIDTISPNLEAAVVSSCYAKRKHAHLTSPARLTYEIGFAKQCLANHGFNTPIFSYPLNLGSDNPTIVNLVAYYDLARSGSNPLMFLVRVQ
jgi:hypothetical protein